MLKTIEPYANWKLIEHELRVEVQCARLADTTAFDWATLDDSLRCNRIAQPPAIKAMLFQFLKTEFNV